MLQKSPNIKATFEWLFATNNFQKLHNLVALTKRDQKAKFNYFRRIANMYFLVTLIMTYVIDNSPVDGTSWLLSMFFVLIVTMIKQAYEDYLRHQNDK